MKRIFLLTLLLLLKTAAFSQQIDAEAQQFLDSLGIKYDPNDPDGEAKFEKALREKFTGLMDSATKVASNTETDPFNTEGLKGNMLRELNEGNDTLSTSFEFMQTTPILIINMDKPDPRFYNSEGFQLPSNLQTLIIRGNGSGIKLDLDALFGKLNPETLTELYITNNKLGISVIPEGIGELRNLTKLGLFGNHITQLPSSIGNLTELELLYIDVNPIAEFPGTIGKLHNLKTLGIAKTEIGETEKQRIHKMLPNCNILVK
jgi:Leucine-rich repeat (LRR) protein